MASCYTLLYSNFVTCFTKPQNNTDNGEKQLHATTSSAIK